METGTILPTYFEGELDQTGAERENPGEAYGFGGDPCSFGGQGCIFGGDPYSFGGQLLTISAKRD
jgi:hypothetical protein